MLLEITNIDSDLILEFMNRVIALEKRVKDLEEQLLERNQIDKKDSFKTVVKKNYTKYLYRGEIYGKAKLVLKVLKNLTEEKYWLFDKYKEIFKRSIQGSFGVFITLDEYLNKYKDKEDEGKRRFFIDSPLRIKDVTIYVCSQWRYDNLSKFLEIPVVKELGIKSIENDMDLYQKY